MPWIYGKGIPKDTTRIPSMCFLRKMTLLHIRHLMQFNENKQILYTEMHICVTDWSFSSVT